MKQLFRILILFLFMVPVCAQVIHAQGKLLKKVQERAGDKVVNAIFGDNKSSDESENTAQPADEQGSSETSISNTRGGGLTNTPPDVEANIAGAGSAFGKKNYSGAKYSVRQAILGIEMEIGQNILDQMPESVKGLDRVPGEDRVTSMSIGFVGLTIERTYRGGDQQLKVTIGNDAALLSAANLYMSSAGYASSQEQGQKQVTFQGQPGILAYDESSGYNLSVPFGQSSIFVAEGINFADEQEIMGAAEAFDLEKIKKELGEK
jgi:hypothetical protein